MDDATSVAMIAYAYVKNRGFQVRDPLCPKIEFVQQFGTREELIQYVQDNCVKNANTTQNSLMIAAINSYYRCVLVLHDVINKDGTDIVIVPLPGDVRPDERLLRLLDTLAHPRTS